MAALLPTFTTLGSGPTVLMLHDADGDHLTFAPQVETLATAGYRAVAWDMPGYGRSAPVEPYTFKALAQSCLALIEALRCGPVTLVGHGMGAMVALEAAVRDASQVRRMVLCAGGPALDAQAGKARATGQREHGGDDDAPGQRPQRRPGTAGAVPRVSDGAESRSKRVA